MYKLRDDLALVQTLDFFTPIVDDPFDYGRIAALNSMNDVWAMGGTPVTAMAITCFPRTGVDYSILAEIMKGGLTTLIENGVTLIGGHSVDNADIMFGYSVTGTVDPRKIARNSGALPGDKLVLTKPLGTGIISSAIKFQRVSPEGEAAALAAMLHSARNASVIMQEFGIRAATDITGFGLIGHAWEVARASKLSFCIEASSVPSLPQVMELAEAGYVTRGNKTNLEYVGGDISFDESVPAPVRSLLLDPQTAGGLLLCVPEEKLEAILERLRSEYPATAVIGSVLPKGEHSIRVI